MSIFTPAENLRQHRPLLLAMEAIGWFHMAGKARMEFLRKHGGDNIRYDERKWHDLETPPFPWDLLMEWTKRLYGIHIPNNAWPGSSKEFTEKHAEKKGKGLLGLLQAAHGIVSGVEKNLPASTSGYLNQTVLHMWLTSPWGYPKRNLLADPPEILSPQGWKQLIQEIRRVLEEACRLGANRPPADVPAWRRWREQAIGEGSFIRRAFLSTLAETRLPNNDVTLWDQSYVAAALFKSAVAGALLQGSSFPWSDRGIKNKVRWRLLTVAIGTEHYEARSVKIGDWTGAQRVLNEFFDQVAHLIEVDLALGSLLYRDGTVAIFSFPGERFDEEEQERQQRNNSNFRYDESHFAPWLEGWKEWLQEQVDAMAQNLDFETPPLVLLSHPTRSLVPIVQERQKARKTTSIPIHRPWNIRWSIPEEARSHVCPVCQVRLNGDPTSRSKPCQICRNRRYHRRDDWVQSRLGYDTIWFEEIADRNGRLALLTLSLDIESWLSGEQVDSLRAQAIPEWARFNPSLSEFWQRDKSRRGYIANPIKSSDLMDKLTQEIKERFKDAANNWHFPDTDLFMANLQEGFRFTRRMNPRQSGERPQDYEERLWKTFYQQIVEDRTPDPSWEWDLLTNEQRSARLAHQLFRKLPSPGRVYRFWREAEDFFHDLLREFRQIASRSDNPWRVRRLVLIPRDKNGWQDLTLYNGRWSGMPLSMVYVQSLGGFVTASNLARLLRPEEAKEAFQGETIPLEDEDRSGRKAMEVEDVRELSRAYPHLGIYAPVIPVDISPLRFRVLVPLETASECVDLAVSWWKERFSRVWDRLPLRTGIVAFHRLVPYQAVVEAIRNIEDTLMQQQETFWLVDDIEKHTGIVALYLRRGDQTMLRIIPVTMPDGREDVFYPYLEVEDRELRFPRDFRHPEGRIFRHAADLKVGDSVKLSPSSLMTLFMDSTAARFRIETPQLLDDWQHMRQIWDLLRRVAPSQTALQHLKSEVARLESSWRAPGGEWEAPEGLRKDTYRVLLAHHLDNPPKSALENLTQAAMKGWLSWALDWHLTVLKENVKQGG